MQQWLIIGGTSRSGTTSVYQYLRGHPSICQSTMKETGYFLEDENPLPRPHRYKPSLDGYASYFTHGISEQIWMEATPHYLYSEVAAARIFQANPHAKLVFLLREPISRLISWHRFGMLKGLIQKRITFAEFIEMQVENAKVDTPFSQRVLSDGRYARNFARWLDIFPRESILILKYSDLSRNPRSVMEQIAAFARIDAEFYRDYTFEIQNPSYEVRSVLLGKLYHAFQWRLRWVVRNSPVRDQVRAFERRGLQPLFQRLNSQPKRPDVIPDEIQKRLDDFYQDEPRELTKVLGLESCEW